MSKSERLSAARRKKKADPGQQQKSGAAKPTYVSTDKKKKKMKESYTRALTPLSEKAQKCWKGYEKKGTKKMFGKTYNNCVKKEEVEIVDEAMSSYDKARKAAAKRAADRNALRRAGKMGGRMENETYRNEMGTRMHHKGYKAEEVEIVDEAKYEKGASDYGKTSIRNKRAFGKGGNAADPKERGGAKMLRHDSHTKRRGVKKNNKYGATNKPPVDGAPSDEFKKDRYASMRTEAKVDMKTPDYKRATVRDKRYGNPHGSHELGGGIRKDRRADHEAKRGVKTKGNNPVKDESVRQRRSPGLQLSSFSIIEKLKMTRKEYGKIHKDFKSDDPKKPRTTKYVPGKGTVSMPVELTDEVSPTVARNDAINKANAMKAAKEREAKKPSADVIAARKRQYKGGSSYTTADKKKVIQSYKEEVTAKERMKRDAGAIAKKKMRNKEHRKYVNFLDVDESVAISEKIKYDKKGSSMDYFLGKDPKKTDEYKKSKKKNESSCECKHESFKDWLQEGNNTARMLHKSKTQVTGNVSADRGSDEKKNQASRKGLEKDLKKKGIGYKKGVGKYKYDSGETGTEVSYQTSKPDKMSKRRFGKTMRRLGRKHGQESVITKDKNKPARLHDTESKKPGKSINVGKSKGGSNPSGMGQTSGDKVRSGKLPSKSKKGAYHYG